MNVVLGWLGVLFLVIVPGYVLWLSLGSSLKLHLSSLETVAFVFLGGIILASVPAVVLAELGLFSYLSLAITLFVICALILYLRWRTTDTFRPGLPLKPLPLPDLIAVLLLAGAAYASREPFEYIIGGRDHGVYINTGIHIAKDGRIIIQDPDLAALSPEAATLLTNPETRVDIHGFPGPWSEGQRLAGLTIRDRGAGRILPHGFHLFPVWIAIFYAAGGLPLALSATPFFALLSLLLIYLTARRVFGQGPAILALLFLTLSVGQFWFIRYPTAEILIRVFFWGGLLATLASAESRSRLVAAMAGASFGLMHLAKLDMVFLPPILGLFFAYLWIRQKWGAHLWAFLVAYAALAVLALLHALFFSTIYFLDQATRDLLPGFLARPLIQAADGHPYPADLLGRLFSDYWAGMLALLAGLAVIIWLLSRVRPYLSQWLSVREEPPWMLNGIALFGLAWLGTLAAIQWFSGARDGLAVLVPNLEMMAWYLTPLGLLLGVAGFFQFIAGARGRDENLLWLMVLGNALPLLILGTLTSPDHFWAARRYMPIVFPLMLICAAQVIWELIPPDPDRFFKRLLPVALLLMILAGLWQRLEPVAGVVEYQGLTSQTRDLAGRFPDNAVLLLENSDVAGRIALPLWMIFDLTVFTTPQEALNEPAIAEAVGRWQNAGRPVFWLDSDGDGPASGATGVFDYDNTWAMHTPLVERPADHLPFASGIYSAALDSYRITGARSGSIQTAIGIQVADGSQDELVQGMHTPEWLEGLTPQRRTSGEVTLRFPTEGRPVSLLLMVADGRPESLPPAEISVVRGDSRLGAIQVGQTAELVRLPLAGQDPSPEGEVILQLLVSTWVPDDYLGNGDRRDLGIYLQWARLVVSEPG